MNKKKNSIHQPVWRPISKIRDKSIDRATYRQCQEKDVCIEYEDLLKQLSPLILGCREVGLVNENNYKIAKYNTSKESNNDFRS